MKPAPDQPDQALCVHVVAPEGYGEIMLSRLYP